MCVGEEVGSCFVLVECRRIIIIIMIIIIIIIIIIIRAETNAISSE